jgi:hypothetical protein
MNGIKESAALRFGFFSCIFKTSGRSFKKSVADNIIFAISETKISEVIIPHKVGRTVLLEEGRSSCTRNMI